MLTCVADGVASLRAYGVFGLHVWYFTHPRFVASRCNSTQLRAGQRSSVVVLFIYCLCMRSFNPISQEVHERVSVSRKRPGVYEVNGREARISDCTPERDLLTLSITSVALCWSIRTQATLQLCWRQVACTHRI